MVCFGFKHAIDSCIALFQQFQVKCSKIETAWNNLVNSSPKRLILWGEKVKKIIRDQVYLFASVAELAVSYRIVKNKNLEILV